MGFSSSSLPKDRICLLIVREWLIAYFSESSLKLCITVSYPLFRDVDVRNAQERQNIAPGKAEGLPNPCVGFSKECHFLDFARIWLFLKIIPLFFSSLLPQPVCASVSIMISFNLQLPLKYSSQCYLFMLHSYDTDRKAELSSDSFADHGKAPTTVRRAWKPVNCSYQ